MSQIDFSADDTSLYSVVADALKSVFTMHVRSHLDYCGFIFHIHELFGNFSTDVNLNDQMRKLESFNIKQF